MLISEQDCGTKYLYFWWLRMKQQASSHLGARFLKLYAFMCESLF